jgi:SAM-dependent methyltransferase
MYQARVLAQGSRVRAIDSRAVARNFALYDKIAGRFLPRDRQAAIVDLGCGFGGFVAYLRERGYTRVCGIDLNEQMVEAARRLRIDGVRHGDLRSFVDAAQGEYALITAFDVIEHFAKDEIIDILGRVHRALSGEGRVIISTLNAMSKYGRWCRYADFTHEHIFDAWSIRQCLAATGFGQIKVMPLKPVVRGPASAARWLLWQVWEPWLKLSLAVESGWESGQVFTPNLVAVADKQAPSEKCR